jgi:hypothetical protein
VKCARFGTIDDQGPDQMKGAGEQGLELYSTTSVDCGRKHKWIAFVTDFTI